LGEFIYFFLLSPTHTNCFDEATSKSHFSEAARLMKTGISYRSVGIFL